MKTPATSPLTAVSRSCFVALILSLAAFPRIAWADQPPVVTAPASVLANEGQNFCITVNSSDPDGDPITSCTVSGAPPGSTFTPAPGGGSTFCWTPSFSAAGTYTVTFTCCNALCGSATTVITVNNVNRQPGVTAPSTASGVEGSPIATITATATDADAMDFLAITQSGKPASLTFTAQAAGPSPRTATITGAPAFGSGGSYSIVWTVNDGTGATNATATTTTVLTIGGERPVPAITAPATASGAVGSPITPITATATDADAAAVLTITQTGKPADLTFTTNSPGVSPRTATITGTPGCGDTGSYSILWTANDGIASASTTTVLTMASSNQQPAITAPATASGTEGTAIATITATATDPDCAGTLTITQAGKPASLTFTAQAPGPSPRTATINGTPAFGSGGTYSIVWTANDGTGATNATASTTTVLTICGGGQPPAITAPPTANGAEGAPIAITATATDPDAANTLTITQTGKPASLVFTAQAPGPSPRTATITGTPSFTDGGSYSIVWTVSDGTGACSATASTTTVLTICNCQQQPAITAPATASAAEGCPIATITAIATDADAANNLTITQTGKPADLTFTTNSPGVSPRTATITGTPGFTDAGTYTIVWTVNDGTGSTNATASTTTVLNIGNTNRAPVITAPATASGVEGAPIATITATATDADAGTTLTITQAGKPADLTFTTNSPGPSPRTATITGTPGFADAGTYTIVWTVFSTGCTGQVSATATTLLTIAPGQNRCPVANPGGPYSGVIGAPISFNGSGSSDPDGDPLTYAWDFGDGGTASSPTPVHAYLAAGNFAVTLMVTDNGNGDPTKACSDNATTTATIMTACPATVFNGYDVIKLATGKPTWFAFVQPAGGCYANSDVVTSSFVLKYAGNQIAVDARRTSVGGDRSGDGIEEIRVSFSKPDLRTLFAGLPNGHNVVEVAIEANLGTGGILHGTTQVDVVSSGSTSAAATISPNPMNPAATLTFTTTRSGSAKVEMFDIRGRLVRTILDERSLDAGVHAVRIEGRGLRGESLASGVYFIRGVSADGEFKQTIAILK